MEGKDFQVERALHKVDGVENAVVNLTLEKARVDGNVKFDQLIEAIENIGYEAERIDQRVQQDSATPDESLSIAKTNMVLLGWLPQSLCCG